MGQCWTILNSVKPRRAHKHQTQCLTSVARNAGGGASGFALEICGVNWQLDILSISVKYQQP
jgi:hypothetical protein